MYFHACKSKILVICFIHHRINRQIIQTAKNALLGNSKNSRKKSIRNILIILKCSRKEISHKSNNFIVKIFGISFLNRRIIFINNNNRGFVIMLHEHSGQFFQCRRQINFRCRAFYNSLKIFLLILRNTFTFQKFLIPSIFRL